ncbi:MAG: class I SAM-dependent methyltransferase [Acidobacteriota bacterium]|nr:class I SAM-dependent methyltransferase [Acidobacteriota bacterium]
MTAAELRGQAEIRDRFIAERVARPLSAGERKDLTDFFHDENADLLECAECGLLLRSKHEEPAAKSYSEEEYDPSAIERVYPQYVRAFAEKDHPYRVLLPEHASIVELGSHYGAFLEVASKWGWSAVGVDKGEDSSRFARSRGFDVRSGDLRDCKFGEQSMDGLFIWNCFDQIDAPAPVLKEACRILKPAGLLVVRTPNATFFTLCEKLLREPALEPAAARFLLEALAYNNLLGFPYRYGYSRSPLERLIEPFGFRCEGMLNSELLTLPLPESPEWVKREERNIQKGVDLLAGSVLRNRQGELAGPWIELGFRKIGGI